MWLYSFSQIQLYNKCPLAYRYKYIDKIKMEDPETTADLVLWNIVHSVLEKLYNDVNNFKKNDLDFYLKYYKDLWDYNLENKEIVVKWDAQISDFVTRWEVYISSYYNKHYPFEDIKVISTEQNIYFNLDENIKFRWIIDRLDKLWNDFIINDYKTNKNLPSYEKEDLYEQQTLYAFWVKQKYWKYFDKIYASLHFLHFDILDSWEITDDLLNPIVEKYKSVINEIETKRFNFNMWQKDEFQAIENPWCRFCEFKSICPLFSHVNADDEFVDDLWEKTVKSLVKDYVELSKKANEIKLEKDNIKNLLVSYADKNWFKRLYSNDSYVSISKIKNYKILSEEKLTELLKAKWKLNEVLDISKSKLSKMFKNWEISVLDFDWIIEESDYDMLRVWKIK